MCVNILHAYVRICVGADGLYRVRGEIWLQRCMQCASERRELKDVHNVPQGGGNLKIIKLTQKI